MADFVDFLQLPYKQLVLQRNEYLRTPGSIDTSIYLVESGSLKVYVVDDDEEQIIRFGYKGNILVVLDSFLTGRPSSFYIQAIKRCKIRIIAKEMVFDGLDPNVYQKWWIGVLENLVLQQMEREIDLLTTAPRERYLRVLGRSPALFQEIPHRYIANYLRMSAETLSRLKSLDLDQDLK
ncbi:MAG: Crp/Fnr family transcriptional regulator [Saprospiraceae bacterium]|nr:Crp/Fnr family transcriptional regulator [Saprospiraceae bacterium]